MTAARPTRGSPASRAASSVSKSLCGHMPSSERHGRSWLAACRIHSTPSQGVIDDLQVAEGFGVDEPRARTFAPDLDQEGPLSVAEAGGAFRVHPGRARPGGDGGGAAFQAGWGFNDEGYSVAGGIEVDDLGDQAVEAFHRDVGCDLSSRDAGCGVFRILRGHDAFSLPTSR